MDVNKPRPVTPRIKSAALAEARKRIRNAQTRADLLPAIVNAVMDYYGASAAAVFVLVAERTMEAAVIRKEGGYLEFTPDFSVDNLITKVTKSGRGVNLPAAPAGAFAGVPALGRFAGASCLALPLITETGVMGALIACREGGAVFSPEDEADGRALAEESAQALAAAGEKERLLAEINRLKWENRQFSIALRAWPTWNALTDDEAIYEKILEEAAAGLSFDRGAVYIRDEGTGIVRQAATRGYGPEEAKLAADNFGESIAAQALRTGKATVIADATATGRDRGEVRGISFIAVPVQRDGDTFGVVTLASDRAHAFERGDINFLEAIANQAAAALANIRTLKRERKRAQQLALIHDITKKASFTKKRQELFGEIATAVRTKFDYYNVAIYAVDPAKRELVLETVVGGFADVLPVGYRQPLGEGLAGAAARNGHTVVVNDTTRDNRFVGATAALASTKSELCVPVKCRGEVVAVLDVQMRRLGAFEEDDILALEAIADRVGALLENAALYAEERNRAQELALLNRLGQHILTTGDIDTLLRTVASAIRKNFQYYNVAVFLTEPDQPRILIPRVIEGAYEKTEGMKARIPFGQGLIGWAAEHNQTVWANDATSDPRYLPDPIPGQERSEVCVPIVIDNNVVGVLDVQENRKDAFTTHDVELFKMFADHIAIAIRNINLITNERRATYDATTLLHISHIISQSSDLNKSLEYLAEETVTVMNADAAAFILTDDTGKPATVAAIVGSEISSPGSAEYGLRVPYHPIYEVAAKSPKPIVITDVVADGRLQSDFLPGVTAGAAVIAPVRKQERLLAYLIIVWRETSPRLTPSDLALLEGITFQTAIGLENLLYYENVNRQTKYLSLLSSLAADASRLPPLVDLLYVSLQKISAFANLDGGVVHLYDEARRQLKPITHFGWDSGDTSTRKLPVLTGETATRLATPELLTANGPAEARALLPAEIGWTDFVSVPMVVKNEVLGRLTLFTKRPRPIPGTLAEQLQTICDQLSIFVENAQLFAQTSAQMNELLTLLETTRTFSSSLDPEEIIYSIAQKVKDLIGADECTVFLLDREAGVLEPIVSLTAYPEEVMRLRLKVGEGITGHVALTGVGEFVNDARADPRSITVPGTPAEEKESLLCVPLIAREEVIGVMTLGRLGGDVFTERDLQLLSLFAGQVAGSIENARLFDRVLSSVSVAEEQRRKLDAIFTSISDPIIVTDPGLHIIEINPAAEKMLGKKAAEVVNRHVRSVIATPALHELFETAQARLETEPVAEYEFAVAESAGEKLTRYYRVLVDAVTNPAGEKVGYVATFRDITETKELSLLKDNFIANVSHELRTPLTSIIGSSELILADKAAHELPYYNFITIIDKEARRLRELVESILDFSLLEAGRLEFRPEPLDVNALVDETLRKYRVLAEDHRVTLSFEERDPALGNVVADPHLIETALGNVVKNAIKFNRPGGWVKVSTAMRNGEAAITVADNGRGIPRDQINNIFTKFYQIDSSSTRTVGGTGLGLAITKRAIETHGGRVDVHSVPDEGSTFTLVFPVNRETCT